MVGAQAKVAGDLPHDGMRLRRTEIFNFIVVVKLLQCEEQPKVGVQVLRERKRRLQGVNHNIDADRFTIAGLWRCDVRRSA